MVEQMHNLPHPGEVLLELCMEPLELSQNIVCNTQWKGGRRSRRFHLPGKC